jgi:hypothetical protein
MEKSKNKQYWVSLFLPLPLLHAPSTFFQRHEPTPSLPLTDHREENRTPGFPSVRAGERHGMEGHMTGPLQGPNPQVQAFFPAPSDTLCATKTLERIGKHPSIALSELLDLGRSRHLRNDARLARMSCHLSPPQILFSSPPSARRFHNTAQGAGMVPVASASWPCAAVCPLPICPGRWPPSFAFLACP